MSGSLSLREKFARRVPTRDADRVPSGSPGRYRLSAPAPLTRTIDAAAALARRHLPMIRAKRLVESLMRGGSAVVDLPLVEDPARLEAELALCGIVAERLDVIAEVDVRVIRERLGLTQEAFAKRFGLDLASVRHWEQGRERPEQAARSLLRVIECDPEAVARALAT